MQNRAIPREAMMGAASGVLLMAFFSTAWASLAISALNGWGNAFLSPLVWLIGIIQLIAGIYLLVLARRFPAATDEQQVEGRNMGKWYGITFGLEGVFIGVASAICNISGHAEILIPIIVLIVGLHFYPFARIFNRRIDYWLASWTCLVALVALFAFPTTPITSGGITINMQWLICGLGAAIATWFYSVYGFGEGIRMLRFNKRRQVEVTLHS